MRSISALLFFLANALIIWRLYAVCTFPIWLLLATFSSILSFFTAVFISKGEKEEVELLKRQKEALNSQMEALRVSQKTHSEEALKEREAFQALIDQEQEEKELEKARSLSFQGSLEEMHEQLKKLQEQLHHESEGLQALHVLKHQHVQLRKQFEEKNEMLKEVRQQLFDLEGRYLVLQRESAEKILDCERDAVSSTEISALSHEEHLAFETQVQELEEIVSHLSAPKKRAPRKKKNPIETMLELQF